MPATKERKSGADRKVKDAPRLADHIADYMVENCRALSIDTLLTRPLDAMKMGADVGLRSQRIRASQHARLMKLLAELEQDAETLDTIDEICRCALNARKHGDLKRDKV